MTTNTVPETISVPSAAIKLKFLRLVKQWKAQAEFLSSSDAMAALPAYQSIIGMGPTVLPLLLDELEREPDHWFWALKAISEDDPVPPRSRGDLEEMTKAWLTWGRDKGLRP